ncbi:exodeoxyribonuclease I [Thermomonas haemolytica]|uniref:Exodeoxyribonuclease I n=2 Tax=Thermomonas haemolytica TaxID=141949 RepID=A0A4R3N7V7_9GAMM|nr:exodeoxyribonuclease I [Thermomonas haemolytica]TCT24541.1 exodeoxyribonuclease I subunit C [Thermomonas haemolytica]
MAESFLFYDLETFGADPRRSRIAQFAAIRTDLALNPVEEPISFFVQPADDLLPSPDASLVTGITPQAALRDGVNEATAFARIVEEMGRPGTCSVGYNSLRFDDEFIRYGLYRNFHDPYEREYKNGNSRWDLLDALRLMHALRPDGIAWRTREDGQGTSFKLEHLAEDNGLREGMAHEALSDVRALIGLARLFRSHQPRLWDHALRLRDKHHAAALLDPVAMTPLLHVSQRFSAARLCAAPVLPLARHPEYETRTIVFDLASDPEPLLALDAEAIAARLYVRQADLAEGEARIALKEVHANKCPALVEWRHLRAPDFARLKIDPAVVEQRAARLRAAGPALAEKIRRVYAHDRPQGATDPDAALYDGFLAPADKRLLPQVRATSPEQLGQVQFAFQDSRLPSLLFRYRARNWPHTLSAAERQQWDAYRRERLLGDGGLSELTLPAYRARVQELQRQHAGDPAKQTLLDALAAWGEHIARTLDA